MRPCVQNYSYVCIFLKTHTEGMIYCAWERLAICYRVGDFYLGLEIGVKLIKTGKGKKVQVSIAIMKTIY